MSTSQAPATHRIGRSPVLWVSAGVLVASSVALVVWYWPEALPFDNPSGTWTALARDFADGILYRPVFDGAGRYGGTRYLPLFFALHGALIRLGVDPVRAGVALTLGSALLFDITIYTALRMFRVPRGVALPTVGLAHASISYLLLLIHVKGDLLAAALNLLGFALAVRLAEQPSGLRRLTCAAVLAGAFFTKFTAVTGAAAGLGVLLWRRGWRDAGSLAAGYVAFLLLGLGAIHWASDGRFWSAFADVASGGMGPAYAWRFPLRFAQILGRDPFLVLIALAAIAAAARSRWAQPILLGYWGLVLAATLAVYTSPGADSNHLLDLLAASLLLVGHALARGSAWEAVALPPLLAVLTLITWIPGVVSIPHIIAREGKPTRQQVQAILTRTGARPDRILSEDPIIPVLGGVRPAVLDPFALRILAARRPPLDADFRRRMDAQAYDAVVLVDFSGTPAERMLDALRSRPDFGAQHFYGDVHFPPWFLGMLAARYQLAFVEHPFVVFTPRRAPAS